MKILFSKENMLATFALWGCFFIAFMTLYFFLNWLPSILTSAGLALSQGISATIFFSIGGAAGMLFLGYFSIHLGLIRLLIYFFLLCYLGIVSLALIQPNLNILLINTTLIGFFTFGSIGGLYAIAARLYPAEARSTGVGWAIGVGRFGSIFSPILAGYLYAAEWTDLSVYLLFSIPPLVAVPLLYGLRINEYKI